MISRPHIIQFGRVTSDVIIGTSVTQSLNDWARIIQFGRITSDVIRAMSVTQSLNGWAHR